MEKTKILIVEDEALIAYGLKSKLTQADYEVTEIADSAEKALASFKNKPSDLVLMDIRLKGSMDGIQTAKKLKEMADVPVIFISDFKDKFTFDNAKESRPYHYITKPYIIDDVLRTIELALVNVSSPSGLGGVINESSEYIFVPERPGAFKRILIKDILYVEADRSYCKIKTTDKVFSFSFPMSKAIDQIKSPRFVKVHRSFVVNLDKVESIDGNILEVGKEKIQMSVNHRDEVMSKIHVMKGS